jgi:subtilisin-like proprotein convertase family protein
MRPFRPLVLAAVAATSLGLALPATAAPPTAAATGGLSARTAAQIDALAAAKRGLTATQKKVDSRLRAELTQRRGQRVANGVGTLATGVSTDAKGRTAVNVLGDTRSVAAAVAAVGGTVQATSEGSTRASVPLTAVETLAGKAGVARVGVASQAMLANEGGRVVPASKEKLAAALGTRLSAARTGGTATRVTAAAGAAVNQGSVVSEGDKVHAADAARARFKVTGTGVTIGVLSDGADSLAASIASGDLPPDARVLPGQEGSGDEGTAMMEIVHDLAPNAKLIFATAFDSEESFANNIRALRAAGADIIVDDVVYFDESPFQDSGPARAVIDVTNDGALYFSSAGNEQNVDDGTAGNWEGDYDASGLTVGKFAGEAHDWDPGPGTQVLNPVSDDSAGVPTILQWNDPQGASGNDYDLYAVDGAGTVVGASNDTQDGNDLPFEGFNLPFNTVGLAVVKFSGASRYFQLTPFRGRFESRPGLTAFNTPGVTRGHSAVPAAFSVAAVPAAAAFPREIAPGVTNPTGPFPNAYTRTQTSERFTSDGPRRVFYNPDGTPITPGNLTSTGGTVRLKPDITAADGVTTSVPGFDPFYGTSAAAPHAAAIAGLILSGNPGISPAEVRGALTGTAIDIEARGYDRDTGFGIVMPQRALARTGATPQPLAVAGEPVVTGSTDGDLFVEPGESATFTLPVTNQGDGPATGVSVQISSSTPGVTVRPASRSYGTIAVGATKTVGSFTLRVPADLPLGSAVALNIRVSFAGALSPQSVTRTITAGQPGPVQDFAYTGPAVAIPDNNPTGITVPLAVTGVGNLSNATFSIDGTACSAGQPQPTVGLEHTFVADLVGTLTAPDGTTVSLVNRDGGSGHNFCQTVFDDSATRSISTALASENPFTGSWRPDSPLSALNGHSADGTWTFQVSDRAGADVGTVRAFSLHLSGFVS